MKALMVQGVSLEAKQCLEKGLQSGKAFRVRRCQILLSSARGWKAREIAEQLYCSDETVRCAIHAFHREGLACLEEKGHRPHSATFSFSQEALSQLPDLIAASPRAYGQEHSLWSLERLALVSYQEGLTDRLVSYETMRDAVQRAAAKYR